VAGLDAVDAGVEALSGVLRLCGRDFGVVCAAAKPEARNNVIAAAPPKRAARRAARFTTIFLVPQNGRGIWIFSESFGIALGQNLHHPVMEVIHWLLQNRAETAVVFFTGFIEVTA